MKSIIKFFLENSRLNHSIFLLLIIIGVYSTFKISKEIFPRFELDMVFITGSYQGASIDIMDKLIVSSIEDEIKNLDGIKSLSSSIKSATFAIQAEIKKGYDKDKILSDIKDKIELAKSSFPSDMNDPVAKLVKISKDLVKIAISSRDLNKQSMQDLNSKALILQSKLLKIKGVAEAKLVGDSDLFYEINIDEEKLKVFNISYNALISALSKLSYAYPIGKIEDKTQMYLSTNNGKKTLESFANTILQINGKTFYLSDIAEVKRKHSDKTMLSTYNTEPSLAIFIKQAENSNAMDIVDNIKKLIKKNKEENIRYTVFDNNSTLITQRLNIVISSILLGVILLFIAMTVLINIRMAIIISLGIPVAFLFTIIYFYLFGYSINLISLIGLLIATGIIVDDAIVVSENIQRHIEEGQSPEDAAFNGVNEMLKPIVIASITTVFAFLPSLMISGTMGKFIQLIPIAVSMTLIASLVEVFLFLPLHSKHILSQSGKSLSWEKANNFYLFILNFFIKNKKMFLFLFIILTPLMTVVLVKQTKFQLFPKFDSSNINISIKANKYSKLEDSLKVAREIENDLIAYKKKWGIANTYSVAGYRVTNSRSVETNPNSIYISINLYDLVPDDLINMYVIPALNMFKTDRQRKRTIESSELSKIVKKFIKTQDYKNKYNLEYIDIVQNRAGPVRSDIQIGLSSNDTAHLMKTLDDLKNSFAKEKGIRSSFISASLGLDEIKLSLNSYGESLGLTESDLGRFLSNYYLSKKVNLVFEKNNILDVKIQSIRKNNLEYLKTQNIPLSNGSLVSLEDVADFNIIKSFEEIKKDQGETIFYLYANVDSSIITSGEVLNKYTNKLEEIRKSGIKVILKGEQEKNQELARDMKFASLVAFFLILISILYMFNSFKETFIVLSIVPFALFGVILGHITMDLKLSMLSAIGTLGLSGVVINDGIIMMEFLKKAKSIEEVLQKAILRLRPILLTSLTTLIGLSTLIFFPYGQAVMFQPLTVSIGFGLFWGTVLNLIYLPVLYVATSKRFS